MFRHNCLFLRLNSFLNNFCCTYQYSTIKPEFYCKKALILTKTTRYDFEKFLHPDASESELKSILNKKGSDYDGLVKRHNMHFSKLAQLTQSLQERGIDTQVVYRNDYSVDKIDSADVVFSAGGDGTFLLAASKINKKDKLLVGLNTDPIRSEGYLCLPKRCSHNIPGALDALLHGKFKRLWRQRIRVTTSERHQADEPVELHNMMHYAPEYRFHEHIREYEECHNMSGLLEVKPDRVLPIRALNEVFVGESLSARASYYEMSIDDSSPIKQKSSGITISTGTGSSSWYLHINYLTLDSLLSLFHIAQKLTPNCKLPLDDYQFLKKVQHTYNSSLWFKAEETRMAYTVRDPIKNGVSHVPHPRGFAEKITVRSRMWDAHLVIDGGTSFKFNDGAVATFEICPEDALQCLELCD